MLIVDGICKQFGDKVVLNNISFTLGQTGVTAIMGASGIGKTTLLNIIAGLEHADSGTVDSTFLKISYKFQEPRLFEWLTAQDNIKAVLAEGKETSKVAEAWLEGMGLSESLHLYPSQLSGGMQQRVSLARALAFGGDLLLLDEPFSAVDSETRQVLINIISEYAKDHAVVLVTHNIEEAYALGADIITLGGTFEQEDNS